MADITLHQFSKDPGTESASPFCVKAHRALGFKGLPYRVKNVGSPGELKRLNPEHRKLPVLEHDGTLIADSRKILAFLDRNYSNDPIWSDDTPWFSTLLEGWADKSLYWYAVYYRWQVTENFDPFAKRTFGKLPPPLRWFVPGLARKQALKQLHGQGLGRYGEPEVREQLALHLAMLDSVLAENDWMSGAQIGAADLSIFPLVRQFALATMPQCTPLVEAHPRLHTWLEAVDAKTQSEHTIAVE
ncbi:MAG: glutathione S-transferase family protein [Myxococcales bacterium]|nr:glutathione S-transferase family protein [Myxococcales bacterium]